MAVLHLRGYGWKSCGYFVYKVLLVTVLCKLLGSYFVFTKNQENSLSLHFSPICVLWFCSPEGSGPGLGQLWAVVGSWGQLWAAVGHCLDISPLLCLSWLCFLKSVFLLLGTYCSHKEQQCSCVNLPSLVSQYLLPASLWNLNLELHKQD